MSGKLEQVPLGSQGLVVSRQGLGCMGMSAFYVESSAEFEEGSLATFEEAVKQGVTLFDTAYIYRSSKGERNEELVGRALKGCRDKVVIATKFGIEVRNDGRALDSSRENVRRSCEDSLKTLGVDYIDLFYQHRQDVNTPIEETMEELKLLVKEGKIKYIGLSEVSAANLRKAHAIHPITAIQMEWSLWTRDLEAEVVPTARELGVGIVAYSPLGRGMLAGKFKSQKDLDEKDWRRTNPRFSDENFNKNKAIVDRLQALADIYKVTVAQLALAWVQARGKDVVPIPGTKSASRLRENVAAVALADRLTPAQLEEIEAAVPWQEIQGPRYEGMAHTFQDNM